MREVHEEQENPVIVEIRKKIFALNAVVVIVIITLFLVLLRFILPPTVPLMRHIPDISISIILATIFFLSVLGLYLSQRMSRETVRIISDYGVRLTRMLDVTRDLREEIYGDILIEKIMDFALTVTQSNAGSLLLLDENHRLVFKIVRGEKSSHLLGTYVEMGKGIIGWAAQQGRAVRVTDAPSDDRFNPEFDAITGYATKSILCVPLKARSGVIGVLALLNREGGHPYRQRDEEIIGYLAEQAAISILKTKFAEDQKNYEIHLTELLLETIDFQQPEKRGHARRVARYSNVMSKAIGMSEDARKRLYLASLLHDVGFLKISIDEAYKKEIFMAHPVIGYEMIKPITFYADIAPFILYHHQRYDGLGYPTLPLKGGDIPLEARIIAIAEAFDVMISSLSYKVPMNFESAIEELGRTAGSQFDPELVAVFTAEITPEHIR